MAGDPHNLQATGAQELRKATPQPWIVDEAGAKGRDTTLQGIELIPCNGRSGVVPVEGREPAAGA